MQILLFVLLTQGGGVRLFPKEWNGEAHLAVLPTPVTLRVRWAETPKSPVGQTGGRLLCY